MDEPVLCKVSPALDWRCDCRRQTPSAGSVGASARQETSNVETRRQAPVGANIVVRKEWYQR